MPRPKAATPIDRLAELTRYKHVSTLWIQMEIAKLLPALRKQEQEKIVYAIGGFGAGMILLLLVLVGKSL